MNETLKTLFIQPEAEVVSHTYLRDQAAGLGPGTIVVEGLPPRVGGREVCPRVLRLTHAAIQYARGRDRDSTALAYAIAIRRHRPDVVLAQFGPTGAVALDPCLSAGVPLVVHFHGYDASRKDVLAAHASAYARLFEHAAAVVAVSRPMRDTIVAMGAPGDKVHLNPCGVDCSKFQLPSQWPSEPRFLAVGRFIDKKGPHLTLLAFARVRRELPDATLTYVGSGPLWGSCRDLAMGLGLEGSAVFPGSQNPDFVRRELSRSRAFVQHSVVSANGDSEGTPVAIMEASASGVPIVATRHAGIPEIVIDGETGLLVDEHDVDAMAQAMVRLAKEPALAEALGTAGRKHVLANYHLCERVAALKRILVEAAKSKR